MQSRIDPCGQPRFVGLLHFSAEEVREFLEQVQQFRVRFESGCVEHTALPLTRFNSAGTRASPDALQTFAGRVVIRPDAVLDTRITLPHLNAGQSFDRRIATRCRNGPHSGKTGRVNRYLIRRTMVRFPGVVFVLGDRVFCLDSHAELAFVVQRESAITPVEEVLVAVTLRVRAGHPAHVRVIDGSPVFGHVEARLGSRKADRTDSLLWWKARRCRSVAGSALHTAGHTSDTVGSLSLVSPARFFHVSGVGVESRIEDGVRLVSRAPLPCGEGGL